MCAVSTPGYLRVEQGTKSIASSVKTEGAKHKPESVSLVFVVWTSLSTGMRGGTCLYVLWFGGG